MKFIRKNGRIIPIKDSANAPTKKKMDKNYNKYGDGANQSARIMTKYEDKANKSASGASKLAGLFAIGTLASALIPKKPSMKIVGAMGAGMIGASIYANKKISDYMKKNESNIETDHYKIFGVGSGGEKVQKIKKLKKKKGSSV